MNLNQCISDTLNSSLMLVKQNTHTVFQLAFFQCFRHLVAFVHIFSLYCVEAYGKAWKRYEVNDFQKAVCKSQVTFDDK